MKLNANLKLLSTSSRPGKRNPDQIFYLGLFMQETDTLELLCYSKDVYGKLQNLKLGDSVDLVIDYNVRFRSIRLLDVAC